MAKRDGTGAARLPYLYIEGRANRPKRRAQSWRLHLKLNVRQREISQAVDANHAATWSSGAKGSARPPARSIDQIAYPARYCCGSSRCRIIVAGIHPLEQAHLAPFPVAADEGIVGACQER